MAATTIIDANGYYSRERLQSYSNRLLERFGTNNSSAGIAPGYVRSFIAGVLMRNKWFTRHVVLDRWFLHTKQESLHAN